eukprot:1195047-Prorocentrum_minimum.AAC.1
MVKFQLMVSMAMPILRAKFCCAPVKNACERKQIPKNKQIHMLNKWVVWSGKHARHLSTDHKPRIKEPAQVEGPPPSWSTASSTGTPCPPTCPAPAPTAKRCHRERHSGNVQGTFRERTFGERAFREHSGNEHSGNEHSGNEHSGNEHSGNEHSGNEHSGNEHSGNEHSGNEHSGNEHSGNGTLRERQTDLVVEERVAHRLELWAHHHQPLERLNALRQALRHHRQQRVVPDALLREHGVHALLVLGGVLGHDDVQVEGLGALGVDVLGGGLDDVLPRQPPSAANARLQGEHRLEHGVRRVLVASDVRVGVKAEDLRVRHLTNHHNTCKNLDQ